MEYIQSGILESYVLGITTFEETTEVEEMADAYDEVREAIDEFALYLERHEFANPVVPNPIIKPLLMATIDYSTRIDEGEITVAPPLLNKKSTVDDYAGWLNRNDMTAPADFKDFYAKIIGYTSKVKTVILWIQNLAPAEFYYSELENFLIIEGSCDILIEGKIHSLNPGDFFRIPLYKNHVVRVTSAIACKLILQQVAA